jgi:iron(III) transport system ATP-binding protein
MPGRGADDAPPPPDGDAVRTAGLTKIFAAAAAPAVDGVDLEVPAGGFVALLGPSGCGKSTTLRLIAGFEAPDAGSVTIGGRLVAGPRTLVPPERRHVGMVFQEGALFPHLTVAANIAYGLPDGTGRAERGRRVDALLDLVDLAGLPDIARRMPHELSGGQQQRVALARALAPEPTVVLLDEPFSSLDAALRSRLRVEVRNILRRAGAAAIFVTHDREEAFSLADEVAVMWQGRIAQRGAPEVLYRSPATRDVAAFVGEANFLPGRAAAGGVETELGALVVAGAAGGEVDVLVRPEQLRLAPDAAAAAAVRDLAYFGHDRMLGVVLASGTLLKARVAGESPIRPGDRVRVEVVGPVAVFPRAP